MPLISLILITISLIMIASEYTYFCFQVNKRLKALEETNRGIQLNILKLMYVAIRQSQDFEGDECQDLVKVIEQLKGKK